MRLEGLRALSGRIEAQARVILRQERPIRWHRIEQYVREDGSDTVLFAVLYGPELTFQSSDWPEGLEPSDVAPSVGIPSSFEPIVVGVPPVNSRSGGSPRASWKESKGEPRRLDAIPHHDADPERYYGAFADDETTLILGIGTAEEDANLARFRHAALLASPFLLGLIAAISFGVAGRAVRSVSSVASAMEGLSAEDLQGGLDPGSTDREFAALVEGYNAMVERLQASFDKVRQFTDNAAHELRTPLTILQGKIEAAIAKEEAGSDRQAWLVELLEETARLKLITDQLLLLARSDSNRLDLYVEDVDLASLIRNLVADFEAMSPDVSFALRVPESAIARCDRALMMQVLHNLLSNAVKYNHATGGFVEVELSYGQGLFRVRIANSGRPIPEEKQSRLFERFYRVDQSRSRRIEGTGLGLSLAKEIAKAHNGDLVLERSTAESTVFLLTLPPQAPETASQAGTRPRQSSSSA